MPRARQGSWGHPGAASTEQQSRCHPWTIGRTTTIKRMHAETGQVSTSAMAVCKVHHRSCNLAFKHVAAGARLNRIAPVLEDDGNRRAEEFAAIRLVAARPWHRHLRKRAHSMRTVCLAAAGAVLIAHCVIKLMSSNLRSPYKPYGVMQQGRSETLPMPHRDGRLA